MALYVLGRLGRALLTILLIVTLVFALSRLSGDPTQWLLPVDAPEATREEVRQLLGLNRPLIVQYLDYMGQLLQGNAGVSYQSSRPVVDLYMERLPYTLSLGFMALGVGVLLGILLGVLAAIRRGRPTDRVSMAVAVLGDTIPDFVLGILLIFFGALVLGVFPSAGAQGPISYVLPTIVLALGTMAGIARWTRGSVLDELSKDYVITARARGIGERNVLLRHAGRNALIPVITLLGMQLAGVVGGAVVVETVFAWPGIGTLFTNAASQHDLPVLQFGVIVISALVVLSTLAVDISYGLLDPRIRVHER